MPRKLALLILLACTALFAQQAAFVVGEKISNSVGFYDASGKRIAGVEVGEHPHEMALSPDGRFLYITDNGILWMTDAGGGGNTISIIDVKERKRVGVIDLGEYRRPHGIDLDPNSSRMVVTIENPDGLLLIDRDKREVLRKYDVKGGDPHMVLLGPKAEWAYVSNTASATFAAVHLESGEVKLIPTDARPQGAVRSHDGKLMYLVNSEGNSISIIDLEKKESIGKIETGEGPGRVTLTPDGAVLVYNLGAGHAVGFADIASRKQLAVVPIGGQPLSLTMSRDGKFAYAGIQDQDKVVVVSVADRKVVREFHTPKEAGPDPVLPLP
jgi:DNA-binding beta-propeller fold protein YncE